MSYAFAGTVSRDEARPLSREAWSISAIVLWEIGKLAELERIDFDLDDAELAVPCPGSTSGR